MATQCAVGVISLCQSAATSNIVQESRADTGVSARQSRHLAIHFELVFLSSD